MPNVTVRYGCELVSFTDNGGSVTGRVRNLDGSQADIEAQYLVGCRRGARGVARPVGIKLQGEGNLLQLRQALYYCEDLYERIPIGKGRHYHVADNQATFLIV